MTDFNKPATSDTYTNILTYINAKVASCAKLLFTGDTNLPTSTLTYNRTNKQLEEWSGSAWVAKQIGNLSDGSVTVASLAAAVTALVWRPGMICGTGKTLTGTGEVVGDTGFLFCNGYAVSRTTYAALFAAIGTNYGAGDGSTTFNLPDFRGRALLGKAVSGTGSTYTPFGSLDHTHPVPNHAHSLNGHSHTSAAHIHTMGNHVHAGPSHTHTSAVHAHWIVGTNVQAQFTTSSGEIKIQRLGALHSWSSSTKITGLTVTDTVQGPFTSAIAVDGVTELETPAATGASGTGNTLGPSTNNTDSTTPAATGPSTGNTATDGATTATGNNGPYGICNWQVKI